MVDTLELKAAIVRSGHTQKEVAERIGISSYTFGKKAKNKSHFNVVEVTIICEFLGINDNETKAKIFLSNPSQ